MYLRLLGAFRFCRGAPQKGVDVWFPDRRTSCQLEIEAELIFKQLFVWVTSQLTIVLMMQ